MTGSIWIFLECDVLALYTVGQSPLLCLFGDSQAFPVAAAKYGHVV